MTRRPTGVEGAQIRSASTIHSLVVGTEIIVLVTFADRPDFYYATAISGSTLTIGKRVTWWRQLWRWMRGAR